MQKMEFPELDLTLEEETDKEDEKKTNVKNTQNGKSYPAGDWKLTDEVKAMIDFSICNGFDKFWAKGSPSDKKLKAGTPTHYICFARNHEERFDFLLANEGKKKRITINKRHKEALENASIHPAPKQQKRAGGHLTVLPNLHNMEKVIEAIK